MFFVPCCRRNLTVRSAVLQDMASLEGKGGSTGDVREITKNSEEKHCSDNLYGKLYGNLCCVNICSQIDRARRRSVLQR